MKTSITLVVLAMILSAPFAPAAGLPPWQFNMSRSQVASFKEFGPYKGLLNGDLETYNGRWHGEKANVQFYFEADRLQHIGVSLYEGTDPKGGIPALRKVYEAFQKDYGEVVVPGMEMLPGSEKAGPEVSAIGAAMNADINGETELVPVKQPAGMHVFARTFSYMVRGKKWYGVMVIYEPAT